MDKQSALSKYKSKYIDSAKKFSFSPDFGKQKPWIIRAVGTVGRVTVNFLFDFFTALKHILRRIM